ncbi:MAG TPA: glucoamylase family protein [Gemmataceae bacterium]|nr:glucoamylase family protein [Gemmataceae bacterium]
MDQIEIVTVPGHDHPTAFQREFLLGLQRQLLRYFLDNQAAGGLVLDRQANHEAPRPHGWCSTAATGMGLIALGLAAAAPYRLLTPAEAAGRVRACLEAALGRLAHDRGMMAHFLDADTDAVWGCDVVSTIDSSWLIAGALWAAAFLRDGELEALAGRLYDRVDWCYWTAPEAPGACGLLRHGKGRDGQYLLGCWDRLNGETVFMYVLGAGAAEGRALGPASWAALRPFYGTVAGLRFNNADLGLFAFEYGLDLLDTWAWRPPGEVDLAADAVLATEANRNFCRQAADAFATYRRFWGLSDGDGPGPPGTDAYRPYSPALPLDGTAHLSAATAAVAHDLPAVWENLQEAERDRALGARGRYGFSNVNLDRHWVSRDVVGIDAGAAVLALDNYLHHGRVRAVFHGLPCVGTALARLGFTRTAAPLPCGGATPTVRDEW